MSRFAPLQLSDENLATEYAKSDRAMTSWKSAQKASYASWQECADIRHHIETEFKVSKNLKAEIDRRNKIAQDKITSEQTKKEELHAKVVLVVGENASEKEIAIASLEIVCDEFTLNYFKQNKFYPFN